LIVVCLEQMQIINVSFKSPLLLIRVVVSLVMLI